MEDNSLESLPPPLSKTITAAVPTTTLSSTADHVPTNNANINNSTEIQQQSPFQQHQIHQSNISSKKRLHAPPLYDWQLLPQEELDRIAYNSRRQKRARLRMNPPTCSYCPDARFSSLAMLSTHNLSKRHLARVRKQGQSQRQDQNQNQDALNIPACSKLATPSLDQDTSVNSIDCYTNPDINMKDNILKEQSLVTRRTAIQRKRKQERDRKKARARQEKSLGSVLQQTSSNTQPQNTQSKIENVDTLSSKTSKVGQSVSTLPDSIAQPSCSSSPNAAQTQLGQQPQSQSVRQHWHCSICGSSWRQENAWKGHLLSAQHLRHTLTAMRQLTTAIRPYGRLDVVASMDPFGWGTGADVVEDDDDYENREENENEDEYGKAMGNDGGGEDERRDRIHVNKENEGCDDDMDISD